MGTSGRLAEAWDYGVFWAFYSLHVGLHDGEEGPTTTLADSSADFLALEIDEGMPVRNATRGTYGRVLAVATSALTTDIDWRLHDRYELLPMPAAEVATVERYLEIASSDIHAALAASGQDRCTLADWADGYLRKLCVVNAAVYHRAPCGNPDVDASIKQAYLRWVSEQLELIRTGRLELCAGHTGRDFPAVGWLEHGWTSWVQAEIALKGAQRRL